MKSTFFSKLFIFLLLISFITISSCKKKEKEVIEEDTEQSTLEDNNLAESSVNDIESIGSQLSENSTLTTYKTNGTDILPIAPCATVTGIGTKTITVDFGSDSSGCIGLDGRTRKGKLIYTNNSPINVLYYRNPGFNISVSSDNYFVDGNKININNKTVTNTTPNSLPVGTNPGINLTWSISANVSIIKANNAGTCSWTCNRTKELINTSDPLCYKGQTQAIDWNLAQIKINGSTSGTNAKGENFVSTATDLIKDHTCHPDPSRPKRSPFISGTLAYTPGTRATRLINFGNKTCDFNATFTLKGQTYMITLK